MASLEALARRLTGDVLGGEDDGIPALVVVGDYGERAELVTILCDEARVHDVICTPFASLEEARQRLPELAAERNDAAVLLVDAGKMDEWAPWLESMREQLPEHVRFAVVVAFAEDVPELARRAPGFWSWIKVDVYRTADVTHGAAVDAAQEIRALTGESPEGFIARWERGDLPDSWRNAALLNLAQAARDGRPR